MEIFEWSENIPVTANNLNEMQNIINNNISQEVLDVYSTSEQRIGTWIDGKPLYRKCFKNTGNLTTIQTGISNIDDVIRLTIMVKSSDNVFWRTIPWCYNANSYDSSYTGGTYIRSNGNIGFQAGTGLTNASKYIAIIEYTKTTD